jgi:hypothetical protein
MTLSNEEEHKSDALFDQYDESMAGVFLKQTVLPLFSADEEE